MKQFGCLVISKMLTGLLILWLGLKVIGIHAYQDLQHFCIGKGPYDLVLFGLELRIGLEASNGWRCFVLAFLIGLCLEDLDLWLQTIEF